MVVYMLSSDSGDGEWLLHGIYTSYELAEAGKVGLMGWELAFAHIEPITLNERYMPL